ncbi:MAG: DUF3786 domain-containing protein [Desulfobacteraceae bacterium]|nr:MAG: DUF3786 domain-containing protein [Desulfobacteraceae bacterium]
MTAPSPVFAETYQHYLQQIGNIDFRIVQKRLDITVEKDNAFIPLLNRSYMVSPKGIVDENGKQPGLDVCIILFRYLLMAPDLQARTTCWVAFRDLKDSGPLTVYWKNEVESAIAETFSNRMEDLSDACRRLNGVLPEERLPYDLSQRFRLLPKIPALLLFNRKDHEFPASCSVLFDRHADQYLDAESLAILGSIFAGRLQTLNPDNV